MKLNWTTAKIKEIAEVIRGVTYQKNDAKDVAGAGYLPLLRATNIQDSSLVLDSDLVFVPAGNVSSAQLLKPGDIVVATSSGSKHLVGKTAQLKSNWVGSFGAFCAAIRPAQGVEGRYLGYFFESPDYKAYIAAKAMGVNINNLRRGDLEEISVPIAPLNEQTRIVAEIEKQFSRLDEAVANLKRVKANLKRYKAAVLKAAVEGKLTEEWRKNVGAGSKPAQETGAELLQRILAERRKEAGKGKYKESVAPDTSGLPELPAGWVWASWDQVGLSQNGRPFPSAEYSDSGVKLLRPGNLHASGKLVWTQDNTRYMPSRYADENSDLILRGRELVMNLTAQSLKDEFLGRICLTSEGECSLLNQRLARLTPIGVTPEFSLVVFKSKWFRRFVDGLNTGSLIQHMFTSQLARFAFPLPPLAEQHQIVAEVERRLSIVTEAEAEVDNNLRRADRLRQSLLKQAFSGRLVPQDPNDEPASVLSERIKSITPSPQPLSPRARGRKANPLPKGEGGRRPGEGATSKPKSASPDNFASLDAVLAAILDRMQPGKEYSRTDLADPLGLSTGRWNAAIQELKRRGQVRQVGEKRGARYVKI